jgi:iron(III) transport system ATP-binding protein
VRAQASGADAPIVELNPERLRIQALSKVFETGSGRVTAVDSVTLAIEKGEMVTILGPSGCGKTTLLRLLAGFEEPTSGTIRLGETLVNDLPPHRRGMPMVFQSYALFPHLTVFENIAYGLRIKKQSERSIRDTVEMILHVMNLIGLEGRSPDQLSGGQQQRVALARCLVMQPKILLFDEPLSNLDAKLRVQMRSEIRQLQRRLGITCVYVTHDQAEAMSLSDRVVVMNRGRVQQVGAPEEIYAHPASLFVADFVGKANFLPGVVREVDAGGIAVEALGRTIRVGPTRGAWSPGQEVTLMIRPEAVEIQDAPPDGEVKRVTYLGSVVEYEVEVGDQVLLAVDANPRRPRIYTERAKVGLAFAEECFHLLPAAEGLP